MSTFGSSHIEAIPSYLRALASASQRCQDISVLTLITVSALNALERDPDQFLTEHILEFVPKEPSPVTDFILWHRTDPATYQLLYAFSLQYTDVTMALRTCIAKQANKKCIATDELVIVTRAWRRFAGRLVQVIERFAEVDVAEHSRQIAWSRLSGLLAVTRDGGAPCEHGDGIVLPSDVDRRRNGRKRLDLKAVAQRTTGWAKVIVTDISIGGLGLDFMQNPCRGGIVAITLNSKMRTFAGTVVWCSGERAGVRFRQVLHELDPIFDLCAIPVRGTLLARQERPPHLVQSPEPIGTSADTVRLE